MKIIHQHLGLPVICLETGERVGDVQRFVIDQVTGQILAVAVQRQWYREPSGVAFPDCSAFGQNVVLVSKSTALQPLSSMEGVSIHLEASNDARQRTAITEGGRLLGAVTDEAFDESTGYVSHYRLDLFLDAGTGRTVYIPRSAFVTASASVVILKENVLDVASDTLQAIPAPSVQAPEPVPEPVFVAPEPEPEPQSLTEPPAPPMLSLMNPPAEEEPAPEEAVVAVEQEVRDKMEGHNRVMMALVIGKTAGATVHDEAGNVIIEQGGAITMEIAQAAADAQRLYELWTNAQD